MGRKFGIALAALALVAATPSVSTIETLVQSERDFAATSARADMRTAFLTYLAEDGMVFGKEAVNGRTFWQEQPTPSAKLTWRPAYAGIAGSGDLGFTTGPYELTRDGAPSSYGWYASVWKLQPDGSWKVLCDLGARLQKPAAEPPDWRPSGGRVAAPGKSAKFDSARAREALFSHERDMAAEARGVGAKALYRQIAADDIILLQAGEAPAVGREAALALQPDARDAVSWEPVGGEMASSGDFAYVYGRYRKGDANGWYMRVWRAGTDGFRIALESFSHQ